MRETLQKRCENFIQNRDAIDSSLKVESPYVIAMCANMFTAKRMTVDKDTLKHCTALLNQNEGIFSIFRGSIKLPVVSMLALSPAPEEKLTAVRELNQQLKKEFGSSEYVAIAAMLLSDLIPAEKAGQIVKRGKTLYKLMNKEHPILTSSEDVIFALLMALSDMPDDLLIARAEDAYSKIKESLRCESNAAQTLSHIFALAEGNVTEYCDKVCEIYNALKDSKKRYSKNMELSVLGTTAMLSDPVDEIVRDIVDVDNFLAGQKGYKGFITISKERRLMHATMLVNDERSGSRENHSLATSLSSTLSIIASQNAMMLCFITAATV